MKIAGIALVAMMALALIVLTEPGVQPGHARTEDPEVVWFVVHKFLGPDFWDMAEEYRPDTIILTVFPEDDLVPLNRTDFDLAGFVQKAHSLGIDVYFSFSVLSRSAYEEVKNMPYEDIEDLAHVSDFSAYIRGLNESRYHYFFDYWLDRGVVPEDVPHVLRKPVEGFYVPIGHHTDIDPLYYPYREMIADSIQEMLDEAEPDGLAFDHVRFFTFDEGYNPDIISWVSGCAGRDMSQYTPKPMFQLDMSGWSEEDRLWYDCRAELISETMNNITSRFPGYSKMGTTMGYTEPARSNGQYVELQAGSYDYLLLMAYDSDPAEVARNIRETREMIGDTRLILGISKYYGDGSAIANIDAGLDSGADGIYLLGYDFGEEVHRHLLDVRSG